MSMQLRISFLIVGSRLRWAFFRNFSDGQDWIQVALNLLISKEKRPDANGTTDNKKRAEALHSNQLFLLYDSSTLHKLRH